MVEQCAQTGYYPLKMSVFIDLSVNMTFLYKQNCCELSIFLTDCMQHIKAMNICHGE